MSQMCFDFDSVEPRRFPLLKHVLPSLNRLQILDLRKPQLFTHCAYELAKINQNLLRNK